MRKTFVLSALLVLFLSSLSFGQSHSRHGSRVQSNSHYRHSVPRYITPSYARPVPSRSFVYRPTYVPMPRYIGSPVYVARPTYIVQPPTYVIQPLPIYGCLAPVYGYGYGAGSGFSFSFGFSK